MICKFTCTRFIIITAHIRSLREGNVFSLSVGREGGVPVVPDFATRCHHVRSWGGGASPVPGLLGGPSSRSGSPSSRSGGPNRTPRGGPWTGGAGGTPLAVTQEDCLVIN